MRQLRPEHSAVAFRGTVACCAVALVVWSPFGMTQPELPDALVQSLVTTAQESFWDRGVLSSGESVRPIDDAERTAPVIPFVDSARVVNAAWPVGQALWCGVEWQPYYLAFMQAERRKSWSEKQIAFMGVLFGLTQGTFSRALTQRGPCSPEARESVLKSLGEATKSVTGLNAP
jgi:hypothetical protein